MAVSLPLVLIIVGLVLGIFVSWILGVIVILVGIALLVAPRLRG